MPEIELTDWLRAELWRRRDQEAPEEACGLISRYADGETSGVSLWGAENVAADPTATFEIGAENLRGILAQIEGRGEVLAGVYHSHTDSPRPSPADVEAAARWPGLTWVIVGIGPCLECEGSGEVDAASGGEYTGAACVDCESADPPGSVPDYWIGVLS